MTYRNGTSLTHGILIGGLLMAVLINVGTIIANDFAGNGLPPPAGPAESGCPGSARPDSRASRLVQIMEDAR